MPRRAETVRAVMTARRQRPAVRRRCAQGAPIPKASGRRPRRLVRSDPLRSPGRSPGAWLSHLFTSRSIIDGSRSYAAMKDESFGLGWRPGCGRPSGMSVPRAGRRSFLRRGAAAAAAAAGGLRGPGRPRQSGNPNYLPSLYPNENVKEFQAIQSARERPCDLPDQRDRRCGEHARPKPSFVNLTQANLLAFAQTSQALENTGVGAYLGAAPSILRRTYVGGGRVDPGDRGEACRLSQRPAQPDHDLQRREARRRASRCR